MIKKLLISVMALLMISGTALADHSGVWLSQEYTLGGADPYYVPEAYYSEPIVKDINKDGRNEIIFGNYSIFVLDAATGNVLWKVNSGKDRTSEYKLGSDVGIVADIAVRDIDSDGSDEIITVLGKGVVSVLTKDGICQQCKHS